MKSILVPAEHHQSAEYPLRLAAEVARRFGATMEIFALQTPPLGVAAWDPASVAIMNQVDWDHPKVVAEAHALAVKVMDECGLPKATVGEATVGEAAAGEAASWRWNDEPMASDGFLGTYARAFDLTVVGKPETSGSSITTLETALFESGGPVLIAPSHALESFAETVVVAWNGSSETARTIAFAKPLLARARRVVVLADDGSVGHRPPGAMVARRLERNGIATELKLLADGKIRSGETILREAEALGCDLLVKGAYTQSRLRQMIFGGATNHILAEANVPVFLSH